MKKRIVLIIAVLVVLLTVCGCEPTQEEPVITEEPASTQQEVLTLAQRVSLEEELFEIPMKDITEQADWIAIVEMDAELRKEEIEFCYSTPSGDEQWTASLHIIDATVVGSIKGAEEGDKVSIPLVRTYSRDEEEIKTAYWLDSYHGAHIKYKPGVRFVVMGSAAVWTASEGEYVEPVLLYIGDDEENAFYSSGIMRVAAAGGKIMAAAE